VDRSKAHTVDDALKLVKETAVAKFDESVDAVNLRRREEVRPDGARLGSCSRRYRQEGAHAVFAVREGEGCAGSRCRHRASTISPRRSRKASWIDVIIATPI
jgi:hypothetical protein